MALTTDLNIAPYYDDHDPEKNFHRILFKPSVAVQARELTQLQTILQEQVERFGENIILEGSIVKGGNFTEIRNLNYVKIMDNNEQGQPVTIQNYAGCRAVGLNSGVQAYVRATVAGLESQSPDLNTLFVKYTATGTNDGIDYKTFIQGESIQLFMGSNVVDTVIVATADVDTRPMGESYAVTCGDGIIFQKGHFVRFENQLAIVSKYNRKPNKVVVGFYTEEDIVDSNQDTSLLDNAEGANNYAAPGADRLRLTPILTVYTEAEAEEDENFLAIQEYMDGRVVRKNTETQYAQISKEFEKRTAEESGDYCVKDFAISVKAHSNPNRFNVVAGAGLGYVQGKRIETLAPIALPVAKGTTTGTANQQNILANYGNYIIINDVYGHFDAGNFKTIYLRNAPHGLTNLATPAGTNIGTARIVAYTRDSGTRYRVYLTNVVMNTGQSFANVRSVATQTSSVWDALGNVVLEGNKAVLKDASFNSLVFSMGREAVKSVETTGSDYVYTQTSSGSITTTATFDLTLTGDDQFAFGGGATLNSDSRRQIILSNASTGQQLNVSNAVVAADAQTMTVTVSPAPTSTIEYRASYPVKRRNVKPSGKVLRTYYVRVNGNKNRYSLGIPDVFSIEGAWMGSGTSFTEGTAGVTNVTSRFSLDTGMTSWWYGLSAITKKSAFTVPVNNSILIKVKAFTRNFSGSYSRSYFSINSYPVDDASATLPADKIRTEQIPVFTDSNGKVIDLRDCIDFRQYVNYTAALSTTAAGATLNPSATNSLPQGETFIIAPNQVAEITYTYYLGRIDRVVLNADGDFVVIRGEPSETPSAPSLPSIGMHLATIRIPAYPSLPFSVASKVGRSDLAISVERVENRRYTMSDIGSLDKRISSLEYYTALNLLEKSAADMVITDANGLDRFKNGIICDNFSDLMVADTKGGLFNASVDPAESELAPAFNKFNLQLKVSGQSNMPVTTGKNHMLPQSSDIVEKQIYATSFRNCTTDFYKWVGVGSLDPAYDDGYDSSRAPDVVMDVDLTGPFADYTEMLGKFVPLQSQSSKSKSNTKTTTDVSEANGVKTTVTTNATTTRTTTTTTSLKKGKSSTTTQEVGDFITDVRFQPFMRGEVIKVRLKGLRPNTRFWFYFDGVTVDQHIANADIDDGEMVRRGKYGTNNYRSDARGRLNVFFRLPEGTFYVGDRELVAVDVNALSSIQSATSTAKLTYRAYNYEVEKTGLYMSTEVPTYSTKTKVTTNMTRDVTVDTETEALPTPDPIPDPVVIEDPRENDLVSIWSGWENDSGGEYSDPIAQTFRVSKGWTNTTHCYINGIDLFFQSKSQTNGVIVEIRNTVNGFPGPVIIPSTRVVLEPEDVKVSANGRTETKIRFDAPVALKADTTYCIVVMPIANDPDYRIWVSKVGQKDVASGVTINSDTASGTLFTSTNNEAWTPYQDENMKYNIYRTRFTIASEGIVNMIPADYEFLKLGTGGTHFQRGETAFVVKSGNAAGTVSITANSQTVTGSGTSFVSLFAVGDYIAIRTGTGEFEVAKIKSIASNTSLKVDMAFSASATGRNFFRTVAGTVDYIGRDYPAVLHLKDSSAKIGNVFVAGDQIRGELSNAQASIEEVYDLPISYMQLNLITNGTPLTTDKYSINLAKGASEGGTFPNAITVKRGTNITPPWETVVHSRTNEIVNYAGARRLLVRSTVKSTSRSVSPVLSAKNASLSVYQYEINNASLATELENEGDCLARYVTKRVTLADGMEASDFKLYITGYRPKETEIAAFVKFLSADDGVEWGDTSWSRLPMSNRSNFRSSSNNRDDFKEFEYDLGNTILGNGAGAYLNNGNFEYKNIEGAVFTNFKHFAIKIVMTSKDATIVPRLRDMRGIALS